MKATKKTFIKLLKVFAKIILGILILLLLLVLFIRSPWGQDVIVQKYIKNLSEKTNTEISVDKVFVTFSGNIEIDGLFLEDEAGDTLVYSRSLEADIPLMPIIRGNGVAINMVNWEGVRANIKRKDTINGFNYEFLMDAFATADTTASPSESSESSMSFSMGEVDLKDFKLQFKDKVTGIDSEFVIGELSGDMAKTDLENMQFHIDKLALSNTNIFYEQTKPFPESTEDPEAKLPFLKFNDAQLTNVKAHYKSLPEGILLDTDIASFSGVAPKIDLENNDIEISNIVLSNSEVFLEMLASADTTHISNVAASEPEGFIWPNWKVKVDAIKLEENTISYKEAGVQIQPGVFNPAAFKFQNLNLIASEFDFKNKKSSVAVEQLEFLETSGLALKKFSGDIIVSDNQIDVQQLALQLNDNTISGNGNLAYNTMEGFIQQPENASLSLDLNKFNVDIKELFKFQPSLKQNKYVVAASENRFYGNITASGTLKDIQISQSRINWGPSTSLNAVGSIRNPMEVDQLNFEFPSLNFKSTRQDLDAFVDKESLGFAIPQELAVKGSINGNSENLNADLFLNSSLGKIDLIGTYNVENQIAFSANAKTIELDLGQLLENEKLGKLNLQIKASGSGKNINSLDASFLATVDSLQYNNYRINGLEISGDIQDGEGTFESTYKDESLNAVLTGSILLDSINPVVDANLEIIGANLQGLGLATRDIRMALDLNANFTGNAESYNLSAGITDGVAVYENQSYLLGTVDVWAHVRPDTTSLSISNKMLDLDLESNASPADFSAAIERHYRSYFTKNPNVDTILNPVNLKLRGSFSQAPILNKVFFTNLKELDSVAIKVDFEEKQRSLTASINLPYINYYSSEIDSLALEVDSDQEAFNFDLGFKSLVAGPLDLPQTDIKGRLKDEKLDFDFIALHEGEELVAVKTELRRSNDTVYLYFDPSRLILKNEVWQIPDNNLMILSDTNVKFQNFSMRNGDQRMEISDNTPNIAKEHLALSFQNFDLAGILSYFNPDKVLAKGRLDGEFVLEEPFGKTGFLAALQINDFEMMSVDLGTLKLDAEALGLQQYAMELGIKGGQVDLDLTGSYKADEVAAAIDLNLDINRVDMASLEGFTRGAVNNGSGSFSGNVLIEGTTTEPQYKGKLDFNNAAFTIATLNAGFVLPNESLNIDNDGIYLDNFRIEDENANYFIVDGDILTESYLNPVFDLSFEANNFKVLNSTKEDNSLFYGVASFDAEGTLKGDLNLPDLDVKLDVGPDTDVTYIVPDEELAMQEREGVVIFVNKENPDAILTQNEEEAEIFAGYDISALFKIDDEAVFTLVIDKETGDNFRVFGEGDLYLNVYPNGRTTLSGRYEMSGGHYEMSLYSLVKRKFEIADGSTIIWGGDPFDASLDVKAIYEVETSSSALMAPQISSADPSITNMFRNELDFMVYLNIDGELMQPKISFSLDMPEDEQGAAGGQVYGRIQQLNNQEAELNKQVFSLLVLNRFYPDAGSDGSRGGTIAIARDNLNQALSDQLNIFSDKLLGDTGVELNFGVDSFTDYQGESPEERTQLDITAQKKLFDDRLIVSVGSEVDIQGSSQSPDEPTPVIGNVSIEYLLTKNGRFRLKGFRRNEYENVIDGQLIVSGIALIFTQEFNEFRELWKALAIKNKEEDKEENEAQDKLNKE